MVLQHKARTTVPTIPLRSTASPASEEGLKDCSFRELQFHNKLHLLKISALKICHDMPGSIYDMLLYLETGEDTALTFTQGSPPVDGVHRLPVEDGAVEQLHHDPPQLGVIVQA